MAQDEQREESKRVGRAKKRGVVRAPVVRQERVVQKQNGRPVCSSILTHGRVMTRGLTRYLQDKTAAHPIKVLRKLMEQLDRKTEKKEAPEIYAGNGAAIWGSGEWFTKGTLKRKSAAASVIMGQPRGLKSWIPGRLLMSPFFLPEGKASENRAGCRGVPRRRPSRNGGAVEGHPQQSLVAGRRRSSE